MSLSLKNLFESNDRIVNKNNNSQWWKFDSKKAFSQSFDIIFGKQSMRKSQNPAIIFKRDDFTSDERIVINYVFILFEKLWTYDYLHDEKNMYLKCQHLYT